MSHFLVDNLPKNIILTPAEINRISVSLPPYLREDPELWFAMAERAFDAMGITSEEAKYTYVGCALDSFSARKVRDLIIYPPLVHPYAQLKKKLFNVGLRAETIRKSLEKVGMEDRKPSKYLELLRKINGDCDLPDTELGMVFVNALPETLGRYLLATVKESLDLAAEVADFIVEKYYPHLVKRSTRKKARKTTRRSVDLMESINQRISDLAKDFQKELLEPNSTNQRNVQQSQKLTTNGF